MAENGNGRLVTFVSIGVSLLIALGSMAGVYAALSRQMGENTTAIYDIARRVDDLKKDTKDWQGKEETRFDGLSADSRLNIAKITDVLNELKIELSHALNNGPSSGKR